MTYRVVSSRGHQRARQQQVTCKNSRGQQRSTHLKSEIKLCVCVLGDWEKAEGEINWERWIFALSCSYNNITHTLIWCNQCLKH